MELKRSPIFTGCTTKMDASLSVNDLWSDRKIKWRARECHHGLCLCQVWTKSDHASLRNGWGHIEVTKWPPVSHLGSDLKKKWPDYVSHHSLSVYQVWTTSVNACPRNGGGRVQHQVFFTTKRVASRPSWILSRKKTIGIWPVGHLGSYLEKKR